MSIIKPPLRQKEDGKGCGGNGCCKRLKPLANKITKLAPASGSEPLILAPVVKSKHCGKCKSASGKNNGGDAKKKPEPIRFMPNLPGDFNEYPPLELPEGEDELVGESMGMHDSNPLLTQREYLESLKDRS